MSNLPLDSDLSNQLSTVLKQIATLSERVAFLEEKLRLVSDINRYGKLQELLAEGNFKAADQETTRVILDTLAKKRDSVTPEDMLKFPCSVLQVIDNLWKAYSQERFGLSVQVKLYQEAGGSLDTLRTQDVEILRSFAEKAGWIADGKVRFDVYDSWDFTLSAPPGCFPADWWKTPYGLKMVTYCFLRLLECQF